MSEREQFAAQNEMSMEFVNWFFDEKKDGCGNAWFIMAAAMWEGWKGRADNREAQPVMWAHERKLSTDVAITKDAAVAAAWKSEGLSVTPLYTAPPVPEAITAANAPEVFEIAAEVERLGLRGAYGAYAVGWNTCIAVMQAAAPVPNKR
ncbi:TPA: hypothetical protein ACGFA2_004500 [Serratia marcescens]|uniref:hypothetical protein n=1 Tax=Serratia marcescens TaxID=615 RepID=UPI0036FF2F91